MFVFFKRNSVIIIQSCPGFFKFNNATTINTCNIIFCLAKGIDYFRLTENLESDFKNGKILILSHWQDEKRIDQHKSDLRNKYMLETFNKFLFLSIKNTGNLEKLFYDCMSKNKQVFLFDHFSNIPWSENGAELVSAGNWSMLK